MPHDFKPPPKIEDLYAATAGNNFATINAPTSGARVESGPGPSPGPEALQLYSLATPNGWKVGILLEELGVPYDAHVVNIGAGQQFSAEFVRVNPNSKIPCLMDRNGPGGEEMQLFESGSIMVYLARKFGQFLPAGEREKHECLNWLFWQMAGQGPMTGNYGVSAPCSCRPEHARSMSGRPAVQCACALAHIGCDCAALHGLRTQGAG
jgi:GST-like protein